MTCLDYGTYVEQRMNKLGLPLPGTFFESYDGLLARLSQVAAIATLSPGATVGSIIAGGATAAGIIPLIGLMSAVGGMYYLSAFAGSLFFAAAEMKYCDGMQKLTATSLIAWMRSQGIYNVDGIEAEFIKSPQLAYA